MKLPLRNDIPDRVCLVSALPPTEFGALLDADFAEIASMVSPGSRKRLDAKARIRTLAVLESSISGEKTQPTDRDLDRTVARINNGEGWRTIFPGVSTLRINPEGNGPELTLRITNNQGEAVRLVTEDAPGAAVVAVRKINELDHFSLEFNVLARKLIRKFPALNRSSVIKLIAEAGIKADASLYKKYILSGVPHQRYSAAALDRLIKLQESKASPATSA